MIRAMMWSEALPVLSVFLDLRWFKFKSFQCHMRRANAPARPEEKKIRSNKRVAEVSWIHVVKISALKLDRSVIPFVRARSILRLLTESSHWLIGRDKKALLMLCCKSGRIQCYKQRHPPFHQIIMIIIPDMPALGPFMHSLIDCICLYGMDGWRACVVHLDLFLLFQYRFPCQDVWKLW